MKSICTVTLVMLCTALFITLDAAPVLPSGYESEAVGEQQFDKMAKTFLNVSSKLSRDGSILADFELGKNFASNFLSGVSKKSNPNDDPQETLYNEFNPIPSSIGKRLGEGGEIQADHKLMQTLLNFVGTFLFGVTKNTDNGVQSHNELDIKELVQTLLNSNVLSNFASSLSDGEGLQSFIKGYESVISEIGNLLLVESKKANPNDEAMQTGLNGLKTILTDSLDLFEDLDDKIKQVLMNLLSKRDDGEESDLSNVVMHMLIEVCKKILSVAREKYLPKNEAEKGAFDATDAFLFDMGNLFNRGDKIKSIDIVQKTLMKHMKSVLSAYMKMLVENGTIQSTDEIHVVPATFLNLFSSILSAASQMIDPNVEVAQSGSSTILSTVGWKANGGEGRQIQSDIDIEFPKAILNVFGTVDSALQKKVNPKDELVQILLTLFNTWISGTKTSIGGAQEVQVDTLPTYAYTTKHFDQRMLESTDKKVAMVEADTHLTDEAKIQLWGAILGSLASCMPNKATDG